MTQTPYIPLAPKAKKGVILGTCFLWFYNLLFGFTMPVVFPSLMAHYDMMAYYAILGGISSLFSCLITPIGGKLGDRFGRRRVCMVAGYIRLILMMFCAIPTSGPVFFVVYSVGTFAGGLLNAYPSAILSDVTKPEERPRWFGLFGTINGASLLIGLLGGGLVVDYLGPFNVFWFFAPWGVAALILLTIFYPNKPAEEARPIDWGGIALLAVGLTCILAWCAFGGTYIDRSSVFGVALLVVGIAVMAVLLLYERKASDPLINLQLFRNRNFSMSFSCHLLIAPMMCLCSSVLVLFGQMSLGLSATVSGTLALPKNILFLILPTFFGAWIARDQSRFRTTFLGCGIAITIASLLASFWSVNTSVYVVYAVMLIFGIGTSFQAVSIQPYMQIAVNPQEMGIASALLMFANSIGVAMFNAFYNIFYNGKYNAAMELGGGVHLAQGIAETFSAMAILSAVCGGILVIITLILIPRKKRTSAI